MKAAKARRVKVVPDEGPKMPLHEAVKVNSGLPNSLVFKTGPRKHGKKVTYNFKANTSKFCKI